MASVKLSQVMRRDIVEAVLDHRFNEEKKAIEEARAELAGEIYNDLYSATDRTIMMGLDKGWLPRLEYFDVYFASSSSSYHRMRLSEKKPFLFKHEDQYGAIIRYEANHEFCKRFEKLQQRESKMKEKRKELDAKAMSVCESVTTLGKLMQIWPEVKPFAEKYDYTVPSSVPALVVEQLSKDLNLKERTDAGE